MKKLVRWLASISMMTLAIVSIWGITGSEALALTEAQVTDKLQNVPVFTLTDSAGLPLVSSISNPDEPDGERQNVGGIFISQRDAQAFMESLTEENPDFGDQVQVVPVSLGEIYQLDLNGALDIVFTYIPTQQQIENAQNIVGQTVQFQGTPLFVARDNDQGGYLTIQDNNNTAIPFFFNYEDLEGLLDRFQEQTPNLEASISTQVVPLELFIKTLESEDNQLLEDIILVPSTESIDAIEAMRN